MSGRELTSARRWYPARLLGGGVSNPPAWVPPLGIALTLFAFVGPTLPILFLFARARFRAARARRAVTAVSSIGATAPPGGANSVPSAVCGRLGGGGIAEEGGGRLR
jgi:hypothetical protein